MREALFILGQLTDESLVIIDELGRGTATADGLAVSLAMCEILLAKKDYSLFVSHFHQLVDIMDLEPGVVSLHLDVAIFT